MTLLGTVQLEETVQQNHLTVLYSKVILENPRSAASNWSVLAEDLVAVVVFLNAHKYTKRRKMLKVKFIITSNFKVLHSKTRVSSSYALHPRNLLSSKRTDSNLNVCAWKMPPAFEYFVWWIKIFQCNQINKEMN